MYVVAKQLSKVTKAASAYNLDHVLTYFRYMQLSLVTLLFPVIIAYIQED